MKLIWMLLPRFPALSPPSRGAWIEIMVVRYLVALRASPPSRGAWIEIRSFSPNISSPCCRPPRGGRGLKYIIFLPALLAYLCRPPRGGRGLKSKVAE